MIPSIATVCVSGALQEKLEAIAAAGFRAVAGLASGLALITPSSRTSRPTEMISPALITEPRHRAGHLQGDTHRGLRTCATVRTARQSLGTTSHPPPAAASRRPGQPHSTGTRPVRRR